MTSLLRTEHLSRTVDGLTIVHDISITIEPRDVVAITGPSGSGKSSFLRLLNRLDEPTAGQVFLEDRDYHKFPPSVLRRRVGMVLQTPFLFPGTVADNVRFGPAQRGERLDNKTIAHWLDQVGLTGYENRDVSHLSGGEAQRVSITRTLVNQPDVLLLDEPTSALDQDSKEGIERLIGDLIGSRELTCIIVTHDADQAARLASRIVILEKGGLVEVRPSGANPHA